MSEHSFDTSEIIEVELDSMDLLALGSSVDDGGMFRSELHGTEAVGTIGFKAKQSSRIGLAAGRRDF